MKKITLLAAVIIAASFASCKKDHSCECTYSNGGTAITQTYALGKQKKKDADASCKNLVTSGGWDSCTLK